jgi:hypothetical protein
MADRRRRSRPSGRSGGLQLQFKLHASGLIASGKRNREYGGLVARRGRDHR